jgi:hypothetical protein
VEQRNALGQFKQGVSGNPHGRPVGSKNRLTEDFLRDFHAAWREHGKTALDTMAREEPAQFVRNAVQLMPRDVLLESSNAGVIVVYLDSTDAKL